MTQNLGWEILYFREVCQGFAKRAGKQLVLCHKVCGAKWLPQILDQLQWNIEAYWTSSVGLQNNISCHHVHRLPSCVPLKVIGGRVILYQLQWHGKVGRVSKPAKCVDCYPTMCVTLQSAERLTKVCIQKQPYRYKTFQKYFWWQSQEQFKHDQPYLLHYLITLVPEAFVLSIEAGRTNSSLTLRS